VIEAAKAEREMDREAKPKMVLVTGSAGFLGRHIVAEFKRHGWATIGVDKTSEGGEIAAPAEVGGSAAPDDYRPMSLPSREFGLLLAEGKPDAILHAAGPASVSHSVTDPEADFSASVPVFFNVLDSVRRHAPECRVVLLSSAAVYGEPGALPVAEDRPTSPISPYGYHKAICESMLAEFGSVYSVAGAAARIFSAYGAGLRRQVLWDICSKAQAGRLELFGTGEETRDFIHADDVARALRLIAEEGQMAGEVYNVANGVATSIRELATMLVNRLGCEREIVFSGERRAGDPIGWRADIARLIGLGYRPEVELEDGVTEYARWFLDQSSGPGQC